MKKLGWVAKALNKRMVVGLVAVVSVPLYAQSLINLPEQPLSKALTQLASEGGINIIASDSIVAKRTAPAVVGNLTVQQALDRLLEGSGLQASKQDAKTYVIRKSPPPPSKDNAQDSVAELPNIKVTSSTEASSNGFVADSTNAATRSDTPISQLAQSVQVVTADAIKSTQAQSVADALANTASVVVGLSTGIPAVFVRGFSAEIMGNGLVQAGITYAMTTPVAALQSVEVLKGADSILAGAMKPGGIVNVTTKQPQAQPVHELTTQVGSYGEVLTSIDLAGAITSDDRLTYLFVMSGEHSSESYEGYNGKKQFYVAPSIGWQDANTKVVASFEHNVLYQPMQSYTALTVNGPLVTGQRPSPADEHSTIQSNTFSLDFQRKFNSIWSFESKTSYQAIQDSSVAQVPLPVGLPVGTALLYYAAGNELSYAVETDNHLQSDFSIGPVKQKITGGFAYDVYWGSGVLSTTIATAPFPDLSSISSNSPELPYDNGKMYSTNAYLQDQLTWGRLHLLASIARAASWRSNAQSQGAWVPNFGILYQATDDLSVYANLLNSFNPQPGTQLLSGGYAPPQTGKSVETGIKLNLFDDRLIATAALFRAAVMNQAVSLPGTTAAILTGGQVSRGAEFTLTGRLMPGLNVIANYTYSNTQKNSVELSQAPPNAGNVWLTYDLQGARLHGWGMGLGVTARSAYQVVSATGPVYRIPGQAQTNANVYYHARNWSATLGVKNVFNRLLYSDQTYLDNVGVVTGRVFLLTATYDF